MRYTYSHTHTLILGSPWAKARCSVFPLVWEMLRVNPHSWRPHDDQLHSSKPGSRARKLFCFFNSVPHTEKGRKCASVLHLYSSHVFVFPGLLSCTWWWFTTDWIKSIRNASCMLNHDTHNLSASVHTALACPIQLPRSSLGPYITGNNSHGDQGISGSWSTAKKGSVTPLCPSEWNIQNGACDSPSLSSLCVLACARPEKDTTEIMKRKWKWENCIPQLIMRDFFSTEYYNTWPEH